MSDEQNVIRGEYTWHPVYPALVTLLRDMQGCMGRTYVNDGAKAAAELISERFKVRVAEAAPKIVAWKEEGVTVQKMAMQLGCAKATVYAYMRSMREVAG